MIFNFRTVVIVCMIAIGLFSCNKKVADSGNSQKKELSQLHAPDTSGLWKDLEIPPATDTSGTIKPLKYRLLELNFEGMKKLLMTAPHENDKLTKRGTRVNMPLPDGSWQVFEVYEVMVMAPELAAKFPEIKTFGGNGYVDKTMTVRLDFSPNGFHAMMITTRGAINLDPHTRLDKSKYICYFKQDVSPSERQKFEVDSIK